MAVLHYNFHSHPKLIGLSNAAIGVFARALSYCSANLTDGYLPFEAARGWDKNRRLLGQLVEAGVLIEISGDYAILDYLQYNPSADDVKAKRAAARDRAKTLRHKTVTNVPNLGLKYDDDPTTNVTVLRENEPAQTRTVEPNERHKYDERAREQGEGVRMYVRDIGKDNFLTNLQDPSPTAVASYPADAEEPITPAPLGDLVDEIAERRQRKGMTVNGQQVTADQLLNRVTRGP